MNKLRVTLITIYKSTKFWVIILYKYKNKYNLNINSSIKV